MLMYGSIDMANAVAQERKVIIFNISSLNEAYPRLYLIPPISIGNNNNYEFDVNYMNWIMYDDTIFVQFMNIMANLYNGMDVFLIVSPEDWSMNLIDSLMKFIQERYGIIGLNVNTIEDLYYGNDVDFAEGYGLFNINQDMERFGVLTYKVRKDSVCDS